MAVNINYITFDDNLDVVEFINMATQVWPGNYHPVYTSEALRKTINTTAWDNDKLIRCVRVLTEGYFFGTIQHHCTLAHNRKRWIFMKRLVMKSPFNLSVE
ncbi:MAG: GNAT family N-acetyltransferase [Lachnospiraceae bacterium]